MPACTPYAFRPRTERLPVANYPQTNQNVHVQDIGLPFPTTTIRFSTQDSPDKVKQFYEQNLSASGWSVSLLQLAGIQPLPTPRTSESLLVHGNDVRGCPLHYVDVIIEPLKPGSDVTVIAGEVPCY